MLIGVEVRVPAEERSFAALASHLSPDDVFITSFQPMREGTEVIVEIALPDGALRAEGTVTTPPPGRGTAGFVIAFDALAPADRTRLEVACGARAIASA